MMTDTAKRLPRHMQHCRMIGCYNHTRNDDGICARCANAILGYFGEHDGPQDEERRHQVDREQERLERRERAG
jgi:hypothetical protein